MRSVFTLSLLLVVLFFIYSKCQALPGKADEPVGRSIENSRSLILRLLRPLQRPSWVMLVVSGPWLLWSKISI
jgi:hypothetical protein